MTGRVEICNRNIWGTVCDDFWGAVDARVACRQLGYATTGKLNLIYRMVCGEREGGKGGGSSPSLVGVVKTESFRYHVCTN